MTPADLGLVLERDGVVRIPLGKLAEHLRVPATRVAKAARVPLEDVGAVMLDVAQVRDVVPVLPHPCWRRATQVLDAFPESVSFVEVLGLALPYSPEELARTYRKIAFHAHPDRGGDPALFRRVTEARDAAAPFASAA